MSPHSTDHLVRLWWKQDEVAFPATKWFYAQECPEKTSWHFPQTKSKQRVLKPQKVTEKSPEGESNIARPWASTPAFYLEALYNGGFAYPASTPSPYPPHSTPPHHTPTPRLCTLKPGSAVLTWCQLPGPPFAFFQTEIQQAFRAWQGQWPQADIGFW